MQLFVGGYTHPDNEVWLTGLSIRRVQSQRRRTMALKHNWTVQGLKLGSDAADLTTKLTALQAGYQNITGNVVFKDNNGAETVHKIVHANTFNGIRGNIVYPGGFSAQGWGSGAEYIYSRYFVGQIEAEVEAFEDNILAYKQSMKFSLGGVKTRVLEAFTGPPQTQFTCAQSKFWAVQSGYAIGAFVNPNPADPLVAVPPDTDRSWVDFGTPQIQGSLKNRGYITSWFYYFEAPGPLNAVPPANP